MTRRDSAVRARVRPRNAAGSAGAPLGTAVKVAPVAPTARELGSPPTRHRKGAEGSRAPVPKAKRLRKPRTLGKGSVEPTENEQAPPPAHGSESGSEPG